MKQEQLKQGNKQAQKLKFSACRSGIGNNELRNHDGHDDRAYSSDSRIENSADFVANKIGVAKS